MTNQELIEVDMAKLAEKLSEDNLTDEVLSKYADEWLQEQTDELSGFNTVGQLADLNAFRLNAFKEGVKQGYYTALMETAPRFVLELITIPNNTNGQDQTTTK